MGDLSSPMILVPLSVFTGSQRKLVAVAGSGQNVFLVDLFDLQGGLLVEFFHCFISFHQKIKKASTEVDAKNASSNCRQTKFLPYQRTQKKSMGIFIKKIKTRVLLYGKYLILFGTFILTQKIPFVNRFSQKILVHRKLTSKILLSSCILRQKGIQ